jgi:hypothetical protein
MVLPVKPRKFPDIETLADYGSTPNENFWANFPTRDLPTSVAARANPLALANNLQACHHLLRTSEIIRAHKCIDYLTNGAPLHLSKNMGPCSVPNSKNAIKFGSEVTDSIASWITKSFVAGPFKSPPTKNFRSNSILAVAQPDKVRICLNVSLPKNLFFSP